MKKPECEKAIRALCHDWKAQFHPDIPAHQVEPGQCLHWIKENHPELLQFRAGYPPHELAEMWIVREFKQSYKY